MSHRVRASSAPISPSAHCTGYVWYCQQLAEPAFVTVFGRCGLAVLAPIAWGLATLFAELDRGEPVLVIAEGRVNDFQLPLNEAL